MLPLDRLDAVLFGLDGAFPDPARLHEARPGAVALPERLAWRSPHPPRLPALLASGLHRNVIVLPEIVQECPPKLDMWKQGGRKAGANNA